MTVYSNNIENTTPSKRLDMLNKGELEPVDLMPKGSLESHTVFYKRELARRKVDNQSLPIDKYPESLFAPHNLVANLIVNQPTVKNMASLAKVSQGLYQRATKKPESKLDNAGENERMQKTKQDEKDFIKGR